MTEIQDRVNSVIVQCLNVDEVTGASHLVKDLGAESIDFLDITFRLEREFDIKIQREELFPESVFKENPEFIKNGKITDDGMKCLREALPYATGFSDIEERRTVDSVKDLFTVSFIYDYIDWKLKL